MDPLSSFLQRLRPALPFLGLWFAAGFAIALWEPQPKMILTVALGISMGMLILGPYAAAALYITGLQHVWGGHLRWLLCLALALSAVLLLDYVLAWSFQQVVPAILTALLGTVLGHDAALAVLELGTAPGAELDRWMVVSFPLLVGLSVLAGYCSLGFGAGSYHFLVALLG